MAVFAVVLAALVLRGLVPGSAATAAKWAAIPVWSVVAVATTAFMLQ